MDLTDIIATVSYCTDRIIYAWWSLYGSWQLNYAV